MARKIHLPSRRGSRHYTSDHVSGPRHLTVAVNWSHVHRPDFGTFTFIARRSDHSTFSSTRSIDTHTLDDICFLHLTGAWAMGSEHWAWRFFLPFVNEYCIGQGFGSAPAPWLHTRLDTKGVSKMDRAFRIAHDQNFLIVHDAGS